MNVMMDAAVTPYKKLRGGAFGETVLQQLKQLDQDEANRWHRVFNLADTATMSRPSKKFQTATGVFRDKFGEEWLRKALHTWLGIAVTAKADAPHVEVGGKRSRRWVVPTLFTTPNLTLLRGLVWMADGLKDAKTVNLIADLCERSMNKACSAPALTNACVRYLGEAPGAEAIARLSRLTTVIKHESIREKVRGLVEQRAKAQGISSLQLEERVVPDYGFEDGGKTVALGDYSLRISVAGPGRLSQQWLRPDGTPQKTVPDAMGKTAESKAIWEETKVEIATIKKVLTAQRDRIDRLFAEDIAWDLEEVERYYVRHPLIGSIANRLIWLIQTEGKPISALWHGGWQDVSGNPVAASDRMRARLWHPVDASVDEVLAWRSRLAELEIVQPTKQAHREVYILTDAERRTDVYSNRMAAHMLKQHQMSNLMAARGWRYQLMGAFDDGLDDQWATRNFGTSDLTAEYFIRSNWTKDGWNDAGIYSHVGTDQLRFRRSGENVRLEDVPRRLFSETMRECDLFVGVASVGNDPNWVDQGATPAARDYWQQVSFGDLDKFAETRRDVIAVLLPRLWIQDAAHIEGKYLIVGGRLNTYKIHLGSSNILMEPGNRYLCIVPADVPTGPVELPFEGDGRLSVILSKAFMLAKDDEIAAADIRRRLVR